MYHIKTENQLNKWQISHVPKSVDIYAAIYYIDLSLLI